MAGSAWQLERWRREAEEEAAELLRTCKPHHRDGIRLALTDLCGRRAEAFLRLPPSWEEFICRRLLCDPRDLPILYVFVQVTLWLSFSLAMQLMYLPCTFDSWRVPFACTIHWLVTWVLLGERYILAMHYGSHRSLFTPKLGVIAKVLNNFPQMFLSNFYGMPCGAYYLHHCIMHHQANNFFPHDLSSTTPYQRDSLLGFVHYFANFLLHTVLYLPYYAATRGRYGVALGSIACTLGYLTCFHTFSQQHPVAFFVSLGFASGFGPLLLMYGNFGQHMFIDPTKPDSNYGLSVNLIAAPFNMTSFNDGYHIVHHLNSVLHWSEMPLHFMRNIEKYEQEGALVFHGINYMEMNALAHTGQLSKLASYVLQLRPEPLSNEQIVAMLRERLKPLPKACDQLGSSQKSIFCINQLLWLGLWLGGCTMAFTPTVCVPIFAALSFVIS